MKCVCLYVSMSVFACVPCVYVRMIIIECICESMCVYVLTWAVASVAGLFV